MATERAAMGQCGATKTSRRAGCVVDADLHCPPSRYDCARPCPLTGWERREGGGSIELLKVPAPAGLPLRHTRGGKITDSVEGCMYMNFNKVAYGDARRETLPHDTRSVGVRGGACGAGAGVRRRPDRPGGKGPGAHAGKAQRTTRRRHRRRCRHTGPRLTEQTAPLPFTRLRQPRPRACGHSQFHCYFESRAGRSRRECTKPPKEAPGFLPGATSNRPTASTVSGRPAICTAPSYRCLSHRSWTARPHTFAS